MLFIWFVAIQLLFITGVGGRGWGIHGWGHTGVIGGHGINGLQQGLKHLNIISPSFTLIYGDLISVNR